VLLEMCAYPVLYVSVILHGTRQAVYIQCNIKACVCNHFCSGKAISITNCECVFVASGIQHAMHTLHTAICGLSSSTVFFNIISYSNRIL